MSRFKISIDTGNAAFADGIHGELARMLREAADRVEGGELNFQVKDGNGNRVGGVKHVADK